MKVTPEGLVLPADSLPQPDNGYSAEWADVSVDALGVKLEYGHFIHRTDYAAQVVAVRATPATFLAMVNAARDFRDIVAKAVGYQGPLTQRVVFPPPKHHHTPTHMVWASYDRVAHAGDVVEVIYFWVSPVMLNAMMEHKVPPPPDLVKPVVAIRMPAILYLTQFDKAVQIADDLQAQ